MTTQRDRTVGVSTQLASQISINFGSSIAGLLIPLVGSLVVVAARQLVTMLVLLPIVRPTLRGRKFRTLIPVIALGIILAVVNLSFYEAVGRIGLGVAVTIEFLGPLAVALITSRRILDVACAIGAGAGVAFLAWGEAQVDVLGIILALIAGAGWAAYILVARLVAMRFVGLQGLSLASVVATIIVVPAALFVVDYSAIDWRVVSLLVTVGILSSAIPYSLDVVVLRRISPNLYSIITSCAPVIAAFFGWLVLTQGLSILQVSAIGLVCLSAATAFAFQRDRPVSALEATATTTTP